MRARVRPPLAASAFLLLVSCATVEAPEENSPDPSIYWALPDSEGAAAWDAARREMESGNHTGALPHLWVVVRRCPDFVEGHVALQDAAIALGGDAEARVRTFYRELPDGATPVAAYVKARLYDTSYARGEALKRILARDRGFGWALLSQGRMLRSQGRLLAAVDAFRRAIVNDPNLHAALLERADTLAELGRLEEAAADYEDYFAAVPDDWSALRDYAAMLIYRLVRIDRALELLARLEAAHPEDEELRMHRAAAYWRARRPREALVLYVGVLEKDPGNARAALDIGLIYYDAMPRDGSEAERRRYWPKARAAFAMFLKNSRASDAQEAFERALAVPYRMRVIEALLGPDGGREVAIRELRPERG